MRSTNRPPLVGKVPQPRHASCIGHAIQLLRVGPVGGILLEPLKVASANHGLALFESGLLFLRGALPLTRACRP
eukprot:4308750-Prorocentrum_lima.AAC.1